jgi:hypothetical protein
MRRQVVTVLLAVGALAGTAAVSYGGEATVDSNGNFLTVDIDLSSPAAGTKAKPRPVTLSFHHMFGNYRTGMQGTRVQTISVRLPRGMTTHPELVAECPLPKSGAEITATRCPASSRVGSGTALADARSLGIAEPIPATVTAFNGAKHSGNATLILQGVANVGGNQVVTEFDFDSLKATGRFGIELKTFDPFPSPPADPNAPGIALNKLDLKAGKTINTRVKGKRVKRGYIEAPTACTGSGWAFEEEFIRVGGSPLTAGDVMSCAK